MSELTIRNKVVFVIAILCVCILAVLVALDYTPPVYKEFGINNFYAGEERTAVNPKAAYERMVGSFSLGSDGCRSEITKSTNARMCGGKYAWIGEGVDILSAEDINKFVIAGSQSIAPYVDGDYIVAPGKLTFINSNVVQESPDSICIIASLGNYIIRWDNVTTWWCHIGKQDYTRHSEVIGAKGAYSTCTQGCIIGEANVDTVVSVYSVDADGNEVQVDVAELFFN